MNPLVTGWEKEQFSSSEQLQFKCSEQLQFQTTKMFYLHHVFREASDQSHKGPMDCEILFHPSSTWTALYPTSQDQEVPVPQDTNLREFAFTSSCYTRNSPTHNLSLIKTRESRYPYATHPQRPQLATRWTKHHSCLSQIQQ